MASRQHGAAGDDPGGSDEQESGHEAADVGEERDADGSGKTKGSESLEYLPQKPPAEEPHGGDFDHRYDDDYDERAYPVEGEGKQVSAQHPRYCAAGPYEGAMDAGSTAMWARAPAAPEAR